MRFPIGSHVRLADYTGDNQIDRYIGQGLTVQDYEERQEPMQRGIFVDMHYLTMREYTVITPDYCVLIVGEYELEAA
jgi:hypothetical protein